MEGASRRIDSITLSPLEMLATRARPNLHPEGEQSLGWLSKFIMIPKFFSVSALVVGEGGHNYTVGINFLPALAW